MQNNYSLRTMIPVCMILLLFSCKPDKEDLCTISVAAISGTYKLTSLTYKATPTATEQDFMFSLEACEKDDIITFKPNGTYTHEDKGMVCNPDTNETGTWSLNGNTINSDDEVNGTIKQFDCSKLVVTTPAALIPGDELIITFQKQ